MRIFTLFEQNGEFLPFDRAKGGSRSIAQQIVRNAQALAYKNGEPTKAQEYAHKAADRFHSEILKAIDEELMAQVGGERQYELDVRA